MNDARIRIPSIKGQTMRGANGKNYFLRAADMMNYFKRIWGAGRLMPRTSKMDYGIVFQDGFKYVTGHVDVFYNEKSGGHADSYFTSGAVNTYYWRR